MVWQAELVLLREEFLALLLQGGDRVSEKHAHVSRILSKQRIEGVQVYACFVIGLCV